ncbi:hypothetical protein B0H11DRAFT_1720253, partial [Mycena galericulata]
QLPLLPAYPFVDYKVQCRSMALVMVDLSECRTRQSVYIMLLRATCLANLAILRDFEARKFYQRTTEEFRLEFARLEQLDSETTARWARRKDNMTSQY